MDRTGVRQAYQIAAVIAVTPVVQAGQTPPSGIVIAIGIAPLQPRGRAAVRLLRQAGRAAIQQAAIADRAVVTREDDARTLAAIFYRRGLAGIAAQVAIAVPAHAGAGNTGLRVAISPALAVQRVGLAVWLIFAGGFVRPAVAVAPAVRRLAVDGAIVGRGCDVALRCSGRSRLRLAWLARTGIAGPVASC